MNSNFTTNINSVYIICKLKVHKKNKLWKKERGVKGETMLELEKQLYDCRGCVTTSGNASFLLAADASEREFGTAKLGFPIEIAFIEV